MADVTDKDREAAKRFIYDYNVRDIFQSREGPVEDLADQFARARAEGAAELDAERAAHEVTKVMLSETRAACAHEHGRFCELAETYTALKARLALAEATINTLQGYAEHGSKCVLSRWEAGRPTPDGGYEWKYAGMWYDADNLPACECDLGPALAAWRAAK